MMDLTFLITGLLIGIFVGLDGHTIVKNEAHDRYRRFRSLNKLVATGYKGLCMIIIVSIQVICKALWLSFLQWINTSVIQLDNGLYEISYVIKGRLYKMVVKPVNGPSPILIAIDENNDDVTSAINPYMGVQQDFHGFKFTPGFFGYSQLTLELASGDDKTFEQNDIIVLETK